MATTTIISGVQYSGIWTMQQVNSAISAGTWPTALNNNAALYSWGQNSYGQLGLGNTTNYSSPKAIGSANAWLSISAGYYHATAIKSNGTLWAWGNNTAGQLGQGNRTLYSSPKQVGSLTNWSQVANGTAHVAAIKTDGTIWTWGNNNSGQLGLGNVTYYSSPKQVGSLTSWYKVSCQRRGTLAIKTDGTLWSWGQNSVGQLGLGNTTAYSSPKQIGALTNWLQISGGTYHAIAIKTNGTLWTWGYNVSGELGTGNTTYYSSPKQIGALTTWSSIGVAQTFSSFVIKTDGTLWVWGRGKAGQLGLGNTTYYSSPKQLGALTNWSKVSGFGNAARVAAVKTDGTLWTWGNGSFGALGLGNQTYYSSPKQVGSLTNWLDVAAAGYWVYARASA
jgi:alpha-tubulin suppressor-like RCC1 family protein